jgi:hypothetical protein
MSAIWNPWKLERANWETYLEDCPESVIRETGLSREKLKQVLQVMHDHRVIN